MGFSKEAFERVHLCGQQVVSIRVNPFKWRFPPSPGSDLKTPVAWCGSGYYLPERPSFTLDPVFHGGAYYVQEASSMFLEQVVKTVCPDHSFADYKILDLCAAPGGKATHLSALFPEALIVANEVIKTRVGALIENAVKWGAHNMVVTQNDAADFDALPGYFDLVVVDAPCSGSGMFRKDPAAMDEWSLQNVVLCSRRQQRIVQDIWPSLKENGLLIYSTCSYSMEENEAVLDWIAATFDAETVPVPLADEWGIVETVSDRKNMYGYRFFPDKLAGEGFFISCIRKRAASDENTVRTKRMAFIPLEEKKAIASTVIEPGNYVVFGTGKDWWIVPEKITEDLAVLDTVLKLKKRGIRAGRLIREELLPDHELALSILIRPDLPAVGVEKETALDYLSKKEIAPGNAAEGWNLVRFSGYNLGWVKILQHRVNNYYPMSYRILKR